MEKLEEVVEDIIGSIAVPAPEYAGLQLTDTKKYKGGTSIKYWM